MKSTPSLTSLCSVIIPTRGTKPQLLDRALRSVFSQTYRAIEVIVVVDGGQHPMIDWPVHTLVLKVPSGGLPGIVRNVGLRAATGFWVAFLDDDDAWVGDKLEVQITAMERDGTDMACSAAVDARETELPSILPLSESHALPRVFGRDAVVSRNHIVCSSVIARAQLLRDLGGFGAFKYGQDWKLWLRCLDRTPCSFIARPLVYLNANASDLDRSTVRAESRHLLEKIVERTNCSTYNDSDEGVRDKKSIQVRTYVNKCNSSYLGDL